MIRVNTIREYLYSPKKKYYRYLFIGIIIFMISDCTRTKIIESSDQKIYKIFKKHIDTITQEDYEQAAKSTKLKSYAKYLPYFPYTIINNTHYRSSSIGNKMDFYMKHSNINGEISKLIFNEVLPKNIYTIDTYTYHIYSSFGYLLNDTLNIIDLIPNIETNDPRQEFCNDKTNKRINYPYNTTIENSEYDQLIDHLKRLESIKDYNNHFVNSNIYEVGIRDVISEYPSQYLTLNELDFIIKKYEYGFKTYQLISPYRMARYFINE